MIFIIEQALCTSVNGLVTNNRCHEKEQLQRRMPAVKIRFRLERMSDQ